MTERIKELIVRLEKEHSLTEAEYAELITGRDEEAAALLAWKAAEKQKAVFGSAVYTRGLIEISSICKNNCLYCGIRRDNPQAERYRLTPEEILSCADEGYELGFRTFVLQGGEDPAFTDAVLCGIVRALKQRHPDCAVTLSVGERSRESYQALYDAGADRYLLRHETADAGHYAKLHPKEMSFENRMRCLRDLKEIGYQVGCGFMVGSPFQTPETLAKDLKFIETFRPAMCGIGPFIPHHDTPFGDRPGGSVELTCYLLSILRLIQPNLLLPATTALGTLDPMGREKGIQAGANVVMPNLSPQDTRALYSIYNNKLATGSEAAESVADLRLRMQAIGMEVPVDRGDFSVVSCEL